jgi:NADH-quinone oxidoreductase subunit J
MAMITADQFIFYLFSTIMVLSALRMITVRNPVHAALHLVLVFFTTAMLWVSLEAEFLGIVLVLVYVGAVMVLFIFVIMMLDINLVKLREGFIRFMPAAVLVASVMLAELIIVVGASVFRVGRPPAAPADYDNTRALGEVLYTEYVYPFEIASLILLVAIIAAITLTLRRRPDTHHQNPSEQIKVKASDRVRVVKMEAEKDS